MRNYGYACICKSLSDLPKSQRITTNRSMIRRTFDERGIKYASELALLNVKDLNKILRWNLTKGISFYRLSSDIFPWASEYAMEELPDYESILFYCQQAGDFAKQHNMRLTAHPGPFNKLASPKENVFENTKRDLEIHGEFFDMLGLPRDHYAKINIHVGAAYGNKPVALDTFVRNFERLPESVTSRLTVENDDRESLYSALELYDGLFARTGIPIVFDYHHHGFCTGGLSEKDALEVSISTWGDIKPVVHYSESRAEEKKDPKIRAHAHSDFVNGPIDDYGYDLDVMIEAKAKELALFELQKNDAARLTLAA